MSDQNMEMQFANPDWQPTSSSQQDSSFYEQARAVPTHIEQTSGTTRDRDKTDAPGDYRQGYQAVSSDGRNWTPASEQTPPWTTHKASGSKAKKKKKQQSEPVRKGGQFVGFFLRASLLVIWLTSPLISRAFPNNWILPLLGLLIFPMTTLTYVIITALGYSVTGLAWLWIAGAVLADLIGYGGQASKRNNTSQDAD